MGAQVDMDGHGCQATSCRSSPVSFGSLQVMNKVLGPLAAPSRTRKHDLACTAAFGTLLGRTGAGRREGARWGWALSCFPFETRVQVL